MATSSDYYLMHGIVLSVTWLIFGLFQVSTQRFFKSCCWKLNLYLHVISGMIMLVLTVTFGIMAIQEQNWSFDYTSHSFFIYQLVFGVVLVVLLGILTTRFLSTRTWSSHIAYRCKKLHVIVAYILLASGIFACFTGIYQFRQITNFSIQVEWVYGYIVTGTIITCELLYQAFQGRDITLDSEKFKNIPHEEFKWRVENGEQLVTLENFVVDVSSFMKHHPGGEFVFKQNIGRDITKYFFGGQALEPRKVSPHQHSNAAKRILKSLIIGKLGNTTPTQYMKLNKMDSALNKSGTIIVYKFESLLTK